MRGNGQRRIVEAVKELLTARFEQQLTLAAIAREVHVSPFHLARMFRRHTGYSLHEYRTQLRLRSVAGRLGDRDRPLVELALDAGFASHSHLTDAFRRSFGVPPSALRPARGCARSRKPGGRGAPSVAAMQLHLPHPARRVAPLCALAFLAVAPAAHAAGSFVEPYAIHTVTGVQDGYLGWAVSELADIDGDGVTDLIAGEPNTPDAAGNTWVYSGRTGGVLHKFAGAPGDNQGYAVADAGDTDGDGVHDVITGAPNVDPAAGPVSPISTRGGPARCCACSAALIPATSSAPRWRAPPTRTATVALTS